MNDIKTASVKDMLDGIFADMGVSPEEEQAQPVSAHVLSSGEDCSEMSCDSAASAVKAPAVKKASVKKTTVKKPAMKKTAAKKTGTEKEQAKKKSTTKKTGTGKKQIKKKEAKETSGKEIPAESLFPEDIPVELPKHDICLESAICGDTGNETAVCAGSCSDMSGDISAEKAVIDTSFSGIEDTQYSGTVSIVPYGPVEVVPSAGNNEIVEVETFDFDAEFVSENGGKRKKFSRLVMVASFILLFLGGTYIFSLINRPSDVLASESIQEPVVLEKVEHAAENDIGPAGISVCREEDIVLEKTEPQTESVDSVQQTKKEEKKNEAAGEEKPGEEIVSGKEADVSAVLEKADAPVVQEEVEEKRKAEDSEDEALNGEYALSDSHAKLELELIEAEIRLEVLKKQNNLLKAKNTEKQNAERLKNIGTLASYIEQVRPENDSLSRDDMRLMAEMVYRYAEKYNLPAGLVVGIIQTESSFRPSAVSSADARGLMQVMWKYHSAVLKKNGIMKQDELHDIEKGIKAGCIVLSGYINAEKSITKALGRYYGKLQQQYVATVKSYWETYELVQSGSLDDKEWKTAVAKTRSAWNSLFSGKASSSSKAPVKTTSISSRKPSAAKQAPEENASQRSTMVYSNKIVIKKADGTTKTWHDGE